MGTRAANLLPLFRTGDWKLIHYWEDGHNELYNLANDIGEQHDLAPAELQARAEELWAKLRAWLNETGAKLPQPNPDYDPAWAGQKEQAMQNTKRDLEKEHAAYLDPNWQPPNPTWWKSLVPNDRGRHKRHGCTR